MSNFNYSFCCFNTECFSNIFASSLIGYRHTTLGCLLLGGRTEQVLPIKDIQYKTEEPFYLTAVIGLIQSSARWALIEPLSGFYLTDRKEKIRC